METQHAQHHLGPARESVDESSVIAAQGGYVDAFDDLFRRHRHLIFWHARKYFAPGMDQADLRQEATIGFFKAVRDFRIAKGAFIPFVALCIRRQLVTFVISAKRVKHEPLNQSMSLDVPLFEHGAETLGDCIAATNVDPVEHVEWDGLLGALRSRCTPLERATLTLYAQGYSFEEMAAELGVNMKSIDNAVWRVKIKARRILGRTGPSRKA